jgi:hypothetical protein
MRICSPSKSHASSLEKEFRRSRTVIFQDVTHALCSARAGMRPESGSPRPHINPAPTLLTPPPIRSHTVS